jgi:hypothetical protein
MNNKRKNKQKTRRKKIIPAILRLHGVAAGLSKCKSWWERR